MALAANYGGGGGGGGSAPRRITYAGPGSDSADPNAVSFAQHRLQNAENAGIIAHQHLPTDALGLISLYHALSPQIAHAVNQGATLQAPYPRPLPAPVAQHAPLHAGGGVAPMAAPAPHPTTLPQHFAGPVPGMPYGHGSPAPSAPTEAMPNTTAIPGGLAAIYAALRQQASGHGAVGAEGY